MSVRRFCFILCLGLMIFIITCANTKDKGKNNQDLFIHKLGIEEKDGYTADELIEKLKIVLPEVDVDTVDLSSVKWRDDLKRYFYTGTNKKCDSIRRIFTQDSLAKPVYGYFYYTYGKDSFQVYNYAYKEEIQSIIYKDINIYSNDGLLLEYRNLHTLEVDYYDYYPDKRRKSEIMKDKYGTITRYNKKFYRYIDSKKYVEYQMVNDINQKRTGFDKTDYYTFEFYTSYDSLVLNAEPIDYDDKEPRVLELNYYTDFNKKDISYKSFKKNNFIHYVTMAFFYKYNEKQNVTKIIVLDFSIDGKIIDKSYHKYTYDKLDRLIKKEYYNNPVIY